MQYIIPAGILVYQAITFPLSINQKYLYITASIKVYFDKLFHTMGFSNIWSILSDESTKGSDIQFSSRGDCQVGINPRNTHILIDYYNLYYFMIFENSNCRLNALYINEFWNCVVNSGYNIILIKDGSYHPMERTVVKMARNLNELIEIDEEEDEDKHYCSTLYSLAHEIKDNYTASCELIEPSGEADPIIRMKGKELLKENRSNKVIVLSGDASLILGMPPEITIINPNTIKLEKTAKSTTMNGSSFSLKDIILKLSVEIDENDFLVYDKSNRQRQRKNYPGTCLNSVTICFVAMLLGEKMLLYMRTYIRAYIITYIHTYIHTYIYIYKHSYIYTYTYIYINTYIHIYTNIH